MDFREIRHSSKIITGILARKVFTGPHSVQVSIVDACNYRCIMCWEHSPEFEGRGADEFSRRYHAEKKNKATVMDLDIYKTLVEGMKSTGARQIGLAGIGEPLLHRHIVDAVVFARQKKMSVWITTNGSLLDEELSRELVDAGLDDLSISLNAGSREEYGLVHANQDNTVFDQIITGLKKLDEYKRRRGTDNPRVTLSNVISNVNFRKVPEMARLAADVGAASICFRPVDTGPQTEKYSLSDEDYERLESSFAIAAQVAESHGIAQNIESFRQLVKLRADGGIPAPCFAGWLFPFVLANGDITYCCVSREVLGNLAESSFEQIWYSKEKSRLNDIALNIHRTQTPVPRSRCRGCEMALSNMRIYRRLWPLWGRPSPSAT
ncbi:MAG: radical SAM protein [Thermoleophilia bacterium]|nr:radical SAM protein [Thermoleophilia bacterium]